jgi:hypothetical protein
VSEPREGRANIPIETYIRGQFVPLSHLAHGWEMHSAVPLTPAEERTMVREPAQAIPESAAKRLGSVRVLIVPYVACSSSGDLVAFTKPSGESHSSVWIESPESIHLILSCRELDPHDTGFEFLAAVAELLKARLSRDELVRYGQTLEEELRGGVGGEIDEDALSAKQPLLRSRLALRRSKALFEMYRGTSFVSTMAEYMHGLWHDVQIRVGPEHLPYAALRRRMELLAEIFPPNKGYQVFGDEITVSEQP